MKLKPYDSDDGMKVWLTKEELDRLLDQPDRTERQIALGLMGRCGLRSDEVIQVTPADVVDHFLRGGRLFVRGLRPGKRF